MSTPSRQGHFITVVWAHPRHRGERRWIVTRFMGTADGSPVDWIEIPGTSRAWRAERKHPSPDRNAAELGWVSDKPGHRFYYQHGQSRPLFELLNEYGEPRDVSAPIENRVILWCERCARAALPGARAVAAAGPPACGGPGIRHGPRADTGAPTSTARVGTSARMYDS